MQTCLPIPRLAPVTKAHFPRISAFFITIAPFILVQHVSVAGAVVEGNVINKEDAVHSFLSYK
jgi:hypothetical protein